MSDFQEIFIYDYFRQILGCSIKKWSIFGIRKFNDLYLRNETEQIKIGIEHKT